MLRQAAGWGVRRVWLQPGALSILPSTQMWRRSLFTEPQEAVPPQVATQLLGVQQRVKSVAAEAEVEVPRLVAVSKTKPTDMIRQCYAAGQRVFGENYVQELQEKATELRDDCPDITWHFIGHLQSNKAKLLARVPGQLVCETVDSIKLADVLNRVFAAQQRTLDVLLEVNTSGETSKSGIAPANVTALAQHVATACPALRLCGLMTIGRPNAPEDQPDFSTLRQCRQDVADALGLAACQLELSMGMSADYEAAIRFGSTNVRVGSSIFGARAYAASKPK